MTRTLRLVIGLPPFLALWLAGALVEAADAVLCALHPHTKRGVMRLRDGMDCPR